MYAAFTGQPAQKKIDLLEINLPLVTTLRFTNPEVAAQLFPGTLLLPAPSITAATFTVDNLTAAHEHISAEGFHSLEGKNRFHIPAENETGIVHEIDQVDRDRQSEQAGKGG